MHPQQRIEPFTMGAGQRPSQRWYLLFPAVAFTGRPGNGENPADYGGGLCDADAIGTFHDLGGGHMELADNRLVFSEKGIGGCGKADQRFVEVWLIALREAVVGAFQN